MNISNYQKEFRTFLVITIALFAISLIYFSNIIIEEIKKREINTIDRYAKFIELVANSDDESINYFIDDILIKNHENWNRPKLEVKALVNGIINDWSKSSLP